jgi:hypothetical protein
MYTTINTARTEKMSTQDVWTICRKKILPKALITFLFYLAIGVFTTFSETEIGLGFGLTLLFIMTTLTTLGWSYYDLVAIVSLKKESYLLNSLKLPEAYSEVVLPDPTFRSLQTGNYMELSFCPDNTCLLKARHLAPDEVRNWEYAADKPQEEPISFSRFFLLSVGRSMLVAGVGALLLYGLISVMLMMADNSTSGDSESLLVLTVQQMLTASSVGGAVGAVLALLFSTGESYQLNPNKVAWQVAALSTICLVFINGAIH